MRLSYTYAKGKSWSKKLAPSSKGKDHPTCERIDQQERQHRIDTLNEQLHDFNKHIIIFKKRQIEQAQLFKISLSEEVAKLKEKRHETLSALRVLQCKEMKGGPINIEELFGSGESMSSKFCCWSATTVIRSDEDVAPFKSTTKSKC